MRRTLAILALLMAPGAALAQGTAACERVFRQCIAGCAGATGACTEACHGERASCIQNPSRLPQPTRAAR
jgi:hypothetical protein